MERDLRQQLALQAMGWKVVIVWECELKGDKFEHTMATLEEELTMRMQV